MSSKKALLDNQYSGNPRHIRKPFDRISRIDSSHRMKANCNFLSGADRAVLVEIVRDGLEEHRIVRRANALILLIEWQEVRASGEALFLDDSTIRVWLKAYQEGGVEGSSCSI